MRFLLRKAADWVWNQPQREKCVTVNKAEKNWRSEECFDIRHGDAEFGVSWLNFSSDLVQYFLTMLPFLPFGIVTYVLCH
ncbi:hypothetical protein STEG23_001047, partial [Scotinomys teguina]